MAKTIAKRWKDVGSEERQRLQQLASIEQRSYRLKLEKYQADHARKFRSRFSSTVVSQERSPDPQERFTMGVIPQESDLMLGRNLIFGAGHGPSLFATSPMNAPLNGFFLAQQPTSLLTASEPQTQRHLIGSAFSPTIVHALMQQQQPPLRVQGQLSQAELLYLGMAQSSHAASAATLPNLGLGSTALQQSGRTLPGWN